MRVRFVHIRIHSTAMADMRHDFTHFQLPITSLLRPICSGLGEILKFASKLHTVKYLHLNDASWYEA